MGTEWLCDIDEGLSHQVSYSFSFLTSHCLKPTNIYWPAWLGRYISDSICQRKLGERGLCLLWRKSFPCRLPSTLPQKSQTSVTCLTALKNGFLGEAMQ